MAVDLGFGSLWTITCPKGMRGHARQEAFERPAADGETPMRAGCHPCGTDRPSGASWFAGCSGEVRLDHEQCTGSECWANGEITEKWGLQTMLDHVTREAAKESPEQHLVLGAMDRYRAKDYSHLVGITGFSEAALLSHFQIYQGYVERTRAHVKGLRDLLRDGKSSIPKCAELRKRLAYEFNGMRLHEYYFANLGEQTGLDPESLLYRTIVNNFGSFDLWRTDFLATAAIPGRGWAVLYQDTESAFLMNAWIMENGFHHPVGCRPLLVMDAWEDAYAVDFPLHRDKYIETFLDSINWAAVAGRLKAIPRPSTV